MHCFYCRQWFGFNTRGELVTQFKCVRFILKLLYLWSPIFGWEDTVFAYMFRVELFELFAHLRADFLANFYCFDAIFANTNAVNCGHAHASSSPCDGLVLSSRP